MFTGIIGNQGTVIGKRKNRGQISFVFKLKKPEKNFKTGSSISVNGVCLTAASVTAKTFQADVIGETVRATTLGDLRLRDQVNLERSLRYGDEMGGHFVTGHIDGRGKIMTVKKQGKNRTYVIEAPPEVVPYLATKGSIAIDGISLTLQSVKGNQFSVGIVPHTKKVTNFKRLQAGDQVNLEADLTARYLKILDSSLPKPARMRKSTKRSRKFLKKLQSQGF